MSLFLKTFFIILLCCSAVCAGEAVPSETAALVNGSVITTAEYRAELARILRLRKKSEHDLDQATLAQTKKESLETLIGRELLHQESIRSGISIKDADVEAEIASLRKQFPGDEEFTASLGKLDLSKDAVKMQIKRGMAIQSLIDVRFGAKLKVNENEARSYYDTHQQDFTQPPRIRLSHILVKPGAVVSGSGTITARDKIDALRKRIIAGEDFALVARESDDRSSAMNGGDLGHFVPGQLGKKLDATAFMLEVDQVSPVIEDRFGYHILKVTERRSKAVLPFEDVREKAVKQLQRERTLAELNPFLKRLREAARIEIQLSGE
jgi:parvulin-like peptidyl-prolyl isomerase